MPEEIPHQDPFSWASQWNPPDEIGPHEARAQSAASQGVEQPLVTIGDIAVSPSWVSTPSGARPISSTVITVTDMSQTTEAIPTWAIVCAICFAVFCLLGLLFLLVKEKRTTGYVQVAVQGPQFLHVCSIPVTSEYQIFDINARVNYARSVAAAHRPPLDPH